MGRCITPDVSNGPKSLRLVGGCVVKYSIIQTYLHHLGSILDFCTGAAWGAQYLSDSGYDVTAIDIKAHEFWDRRSGFELVEDNALTWVPPCKYDGIVAVDAIEHFTAEDQLKIMEKFFAWLKPGGVLVMDTPLAKESGRKSKMHLHELNWVDFGKLVNADKFDWETCHRYTISYPNLELGCVSTLHRVYDERPTRGLDQIIVCRQRV
jgi:SAM-dependent methyltransferase